MNSLAPLPPLDTPSHTKASPLVCVIFFDRENHHQLPVPQHRAGDRPFREPTDETWDELVTLLPVLTNPPNHSVLYKIDIPLKGAVVFENKGLSQRRQNDARDL